MGIFLSLKFYNMDYPTSLIVGAIIKWGKLRRYLAFFCFIVLMSGIFSLLFYGIDAANKNVTKLISGQDYSKFEKLMINPKIRFGYDDGKFLDISAKKAIHKYKNDVEMSSVKASGYIGSIFSGSLLITNNGNNFHFSDNPVLIIREVKNEQ